MAVENFKNTLIKYFQLDADLFWDIHDTLTHIDETNIDEDNLHLIHLATGMAWDRHAKLENLMAKLKGRPNIYEI